MKNQLLKPFLILLCLTLISCAGPSSPFGAKEIKSVFDKDSVLNERKLNQSMIEHYSESLLRAPANIDHDHGVLNDDLEFVSVKFTPGKQNWHDRFDFSIEVRDELGLATGHTLKILYNDVEITSSQLKNFKKTFHPDGKGYTLTHKNFRLPVREMHDIKALFWRNDEAPPVIGRFEEPYCEVQNETQKITSMGPFSKHYNTFQLIRSISNRKKINPNFIAAIIAKESSFNPKAVSWAKAMGLTQVTPIAAKQIKESKNINWAVYPNIEEMSFVQLKAAIATGMIHSKNDWRLDKRKSIKGAIHYLDYLEHYWHRARRRNEVAFDSKLETDLILASYHSGAARVKSIYQKDGLAWNQHKDLQEAKKYFKKIKSYCYSFEHPTDS